MSKLKLILFYYLPLIAFMILIFWLSSIPNLKIDDTEAEFFRRKFIHLFEYGLLWVLIYRAVVKEHWRNDFKGKIPQVILSFLLMVFYAATDEIHQLYVLTRQGKISDLGFDVLGGLLGIGILNLFNLKLNNKKVKREKVKKYQKSLWPILLGFLLFIILLVLSILYYDSYCPNFNLSSFF